MIQSGVGMTSARTRERLVLRLAEKGISNVRVLDRFRAIPRHIFIEEALNSRAYEDTALPIGAGQTISQPLIVASKVQELLKGKTLDFKYKKILEIGSGCGFQSAILSGIAEHVYGVERIYSLVKKSSNLIRKLGIRNVSIIHADGNNGYLNSAPFDAIILSAAIEEAPIKLLETQLASNGVFIGPIGKTTQILTKIIKKRSKMYQEELEAVNFVPFLPGVIHD